MLHSPARGPEPAEHTLHLDSAGQGSPSAACVYRECLLMELNHSSVSSSAPSHGLEGQSVPERTELLHPESEALLKGVTESSVSYSLTRPRAPVLGAQLKMT